MPALSNRLPSLDFDLGETADMLRAQVEAFAADEIAPLAAEIDRDQPLPARAWPKLGEMGLLGITVEEEYGGAGMGYLEHCVAMEEISRASASVGLSYGAHSNLCVNQIRRNGTEEQKRRYLPKLISRRARRRAGHVRARRRLRCRLACGSRAEKRKATATCSTAPRCGSPTGPTPTRWWSTPRPIPRPGPRGITAFLIEKGFAGLLARRRSSTSSACAARNTCELVFDDCEVPEENVLGQVGEGVQVLMSGLDYERVVLAGRPARHHAGLPRRWWCPMCTSASSSASRSASSS